MRKQEYFQQKNEINFHRSTAFKPFLLYKQERDWTCSIAYIRTITASLYTIRFTEDWYIHQYHLKPGPYYSKDILKLGILDKYDCVYGCLSDDTSFDDVCALVDDGYGVMLESMFNGGHWFVFLGYYRVSDNIEESSLLVYDPYYNNVRLLNADEFVSMWCDGDFRKSGVVKDFIAIKPIGGKRKR